MPNHNFLAGWISQKFITTNCKTNLLIRFHLKNAEVKASFVTHAHYQTSYL